MRKLKGLNCILLIDDEEITNFLHLKLIKSLQIDVHVEVVTNGQMALDYLTCSGNYADEEEFPQPGLILLDIDMPLMNGWEFLEKYAALADDQKAGQVVAMLSSSLNPDDFKKAEDRDDLVEFFRKPLTAEKLDRLLTSFFPEK